MNSDYKRVPIFIVMAGIVILIGHYMDVYMMIMPATVVDRYGFGLLFEPFGTLWDQIF